ncbi:hypothetical protein DIPPA_06234 [Diplonema papillatum]|nr:hypothetical protein DIPPA_06234 [Diplonema papillatum]
MGGKGGGKGGGGHGGKGGKGHGPAFGCGTPSPGYGGGHHHHHHQYPPPAVCVETCTGGQRITPREK